MYELVQLCDHWMVLLWSCWRSSSLQFQCAVCAGQAPETAHPITLSPANHAPSSHLGDMCATCCTATGQQARSICWLVPSGRADLRPHAVPLLSPCVAVPAAFAAAALPAALCRTTYLVEAKVGVEVRSRVGLCVALCVALCLECLV